MNKEIAGVKEARHRLLGLQVIPHADGVILRRGTTRVVLSGEGIADLVELILARAAEGSGIKTADLWASASGSRRATLTGLLDTLTAHRLLVPLDDGSAGAGRAERKEDIFFWNEETSFSAVSDSLAETELIVFGVNHVGLALLGNLRGCGFRAVTLIDHPTLRNLDFYDVTGDLRLEIKAALSTPPQAFESLDEAPTGPTCYVVCSDFGGLALMRDWNRHCVDAGIHFYSAVLQDQIAYLGPLVVPHAGPCFECFWIRRASHLDDPTAALAVEMRAFEGQRSAGYLQPMSRVAADLAAIDLLKYYGALPGGEIGRLIEADLMAPSIKVRSLLKVPRCPVCSRLVRTAASAAAVEAPAEGEMVEEDL